MASRFPTENRLQLRTRIGHDRTWSCDKHDEPIKFYCRDHTIPICHPCATKDHVKKQCNLQDIEDVILEMRRKLEDAETEIVATKRRFRRLDIKTGSRKASANTQLQAVSDEVNGTYDEKLRSVKDEERYEIHLINEEADEEIQIINERRERRIRACKEEAEKKQVIINEAKAKLISDVEIIKEEVKTKLDNIRSKNQHEISIMDNIGSKIARIKQNDKTLVNEAPQVIASLDESRSSNVHQEVADYLDRIEREVQRVKFVAGEIGGQHYARIDGFIGKWELVKSIGIPPIRHKPWVCGLISDDEICLPDIHDEALYVTNVSTGQTKKVIERDTCSSMYVESCAPVDSNVIVCGKWKENPIYSIGDNCDGRITLYSRQWNVIRDIGIPSRNTTFPLFSTVNADVARDGMIFAAHFHQSNIYVINPADGKIVNTITMQDKRVSGIQALSSGDIVVQTDDHNEFTVISRSGEEKAVIHCDEWKDSKCYVAKLTDTLYITYSDTEGEAVDQVSCDGNIQARRIVKYQRLCRSHISPCLGTPSGNLVACDGDKLFLYKKRFIV